MTEEFYTDDARLHTSCHHELAKGEVWVGNTSGDDHLEKGVEVPVRYRSLKTVRLGKQAYDVHGLPLSRHYCLPLIVHVSEEAELERLRRDS